LLNNLIGSGSSEAEAMQYVVLNANSRTGAILGIGAEYTQPSRTAVI
jgi:hypothetical protein